MFTIKEMPVGGLALLKNLALCSEFEEKEVPEIIKALQKHLDKKAILDELQNIITSVESGKLFLQNFERNSPTQEAPFMGENTSYVPTGDLYIKMHFIAKERD